MPATNTTTTTKKKTEQEQNAIISANTNSATFDSTSGFTPTEVSQTYADILQSQGVSLNTNPAYADYAQVNAPTAGNNALASTGTVTATGTPTTAVQTATAVPATATTANTGETPVITNPTDVRLAYGSMVNGDDTDGTDTAEVADTGSAGSTGNTQVNASYPSSLSEENVQKLRDAGYRINEEYAEMVRQLDDEYYRARSNYGANAEALAQAGLTNSGYSDYLDAAAYSEAQIGKANALENKQADEQEALQNVLAEEETTRSNVDAAYAALIENGGATTSNMAVLRAQFGEDVANAAQSRYAEYENSDAYKTDNYETINNLAAVISQAGGRNIADSDKEYLINTYGQRAYDLATERYAQVQADYANSFPEEFEQVLEDSSMLDSYLAAQGISIAEQESQEQTLAAKQAAFFNSVDEWYNGIDNPTDEQREKYESVYTTVWEETLDEASYESGEARMNYLLTLADAVDSAVNKLSPDTLNEIIADMEQTLGFEVNQNRFKFNKSSTKKKSEIFQSGKYYQALSATEKRYLDNLPPNVTFAYADGNFYYKVNSDTWAEATGIGSGDETLAWQAMSKLQALKGAVAARNTTSN